MRGFGWRIALFAVIAAGVATFLVMVLWNLLIPELFGGPTINFWRALGLLVLSRILLGGWRGRAGPPPWAWRRRMMQRWDQMTPEEREKLRRGLQSRWCPAEPPMSPGSDAPSHDAPSVSDDA